MESSRASSMAQLSAWTSAMKNNDSKSVQPKSQSKQIVEDEYDEEFEDYDEDFEDESPVKVPPPKIESNNTAQQPPTKSIQNSIPTNIHNNNHTTYPQPSSSASTGAKNLSSKFEEADQKPLKSKTYEVTLSIARSIADPKAVRVQRVLDSGVLNMSMEKFTHFNSMPISSYDFYLEELRKGSANIRQIGVPTDLEVRETETNTDEIEYEDKQVQSCYGDDTEFFNMLDRLKNKHSQQSSMVYNSASEISRNNVESEISYSSNKMSSFLQRSTQLLESLFNEEASSLKSDKAPAKEEGRGIEIFDNKDNWVKFGDDNANGANELVRFRQIVAIKFSKLQSNMMIAAHAYPVGEDAENDLRPFKGLFSVWDCNFPGGPVLVLEASGQPTTCGFSGAQAHIIVAGTTDGSIHLWDLREANTIHRDKDAVDLRIGKGIRKPSYSTHLSLSGLSETLEDEIIHGGGILQLESIDEAQNDVAFAASQFVSLDESGRIIFWLATEQSFNDNNLRQSPWGKVSLVATREINFNLPPSISNLSKSEKSKPAIFGDSQNSIYTSNGVLALIPMDASTILASTGTGSVKRVSRIGESPTPNIYSRFEVSTGVTMETNRKKTNEMNTFATISCISVQPVDAFTKDVPQFILIGRYDGSVDLFQMDFSFPILTWNISAFSAKGNKLYPLTISWITNHSFMVVDSSGTIHLFDFAISLHKPIKSDVVGLKNINLLDLSKSKSNLDVVRLVVGGENNSFDLKCRRLNPSLSARKNLDKHELESLKLHILHSTIGAAHNSKISFSS